MMPQIKSPQVEEGYTRISNELMEAMIGFGLTARQWSVLMALTRKTYGYQKKEDDVSLSQLGGLCGLPKSHVSSTIKQLVAMNVITKKAGNYGTILSINKDYSAWNREGSANQPTFCDASTVTKSVTPSQSTGVVVDFKTGQQVTESVTPVTESVTAEGLPNRYPEVTESVTPEVTKSVTTKENLPKENQQKKTRASRRAGKISFDSWTTKTKASGAELIPEDHSVFTYAEKINLPREYLRLCWMEFKLDHAERTDKQQKDWPGTFANYVRKNYYRLWFEKNGGWELTTRGIQLQKEMRDRA